MLDYIVLTVPSAVAGGFAFAWWLARADNRKLTAEMARLQRGVAGLRAALTQAIRHPDALKERVERAALDPDGNKVREPRDQRMAARRAARKAARKERLDG